MTRSIKLSGVPASTGAAVGRVFLIDRRRMQEPREHVPAERTEKEIARLRDAVERSDQQLAEISGRLSEQPQEHGLIIEAYRLMVKDPMLVAGAEDLIRHEGINAEWAVRRVARQLRSTFDGVDDPYFRERQNDIDFVADRVVENLMGAWREMAEPPAGAIIVTHELSPADAMMLFHGQKVGGIVTEVGGRTSHTAIVARALEVPAVLGCERILEQAAQNDRVAIDGGAGLVVLNPTDAEADAFHAARLRHEAHEREALASRELESCTLDGHKVVLRANIELVEEVPSCVAHGADGVGLYRTEFLYLNRRDLPSEDEHYETYRRLLEALPGRSVTIRTFDLGGEKTLSGQSLDEENPSLGLRAIRYCLANPEMFLVQLRALWRASVHGGMRVMFPLVSSVSELRRAKALFAQARAEVVARGLPVANEVPVGIMVETPAAVELAERLARESAFFSIGSNDLIQYALAVDRANRAVADLYRPMHPAVISMLRRVIHAGRAAGIDVSVCGEMAGDPSYTLVLLALGADQLSMGGTSIPAIKRIVRATNMADAKQLLDAALAIDGDEEIEWFVRAEMRRRFPDAFEVAVAELP